MDWSHVEFTCGFLWCFYQLFGLSFWRHPFTAEHPLVSKWCNAKFHQFFSDEWTNLFISWMAWGGVNFQLIHFFGVNYFLKPNFFSFAGWAQRKNIFSIAENTVMTKHIRKLWKIKNRQNLTFQWTIIILSGGELSLWNKCFSQIHIGHNYCHP